MRERARKLRPLLILGLGLALAIPEVAAAAPRRSQTSDLCVTTLYEGNPTGQTLVFRKVPTLSPGDAIPLHGIYFSNARVALPLHGSAVMAADGMVRLGLMVRTSARRPSITGPDVLYSGETDASFAGVIHVKTDGEVYPYLLVAFQPVDCATIDIP